MEITPKSLSQGIPAGQIPLALVLEGVSARWQNNVLQVLASPTSVDVTVDGCGTINTVAYVLSPDQARHLATQIAELIGSEYSSRP